MVIQKQTRILTANKLVLSFTILIMPLLYHSVQGSIQQLHETRLEEQASNFVTQLKQLLKTFIKMLNFVTQLKELLKTFVNMLNFITLIIDIFNILVTYLKQPFELSNLVTLLKDMVSSTYIFVTQFKQLLMIILQMLNLVIFLNLLIIVSQLEHLLNP